MAGEIGADEKIRTSNILILSQTSLPIGIRRQNKQKEKGVSYPYHRVANSTISFVNGRRYRT